jgi:hypothetical protein
MVIYLLALFDMSLEVLMTEFNEMFRGKTGSTMPPATP